MLVFYRGRKAEGLAIALGPSVSLFSIVMNTLSLQNCSLNFIDIYTIIPTKLIMERVYLETINGAFTSFDVYNYGISDIPISVASHRFPKLSMYTSWSLLWLLNK